MSALPPHVQIEVRRGSAAEARANSRRDVVSMFDALDCAIGAAEGGMQATALIWDSLTPEERAKWLQEAEACWPRRDIWLKTILPAAGKIISDEAEAF